MPAQPDRWIDDDPELRLRSTRASSICLWFGSVSFVASFCLPALKTSMGVVYGWACALVGAMALATAQPFHFEFFLLLAGVSLNLVILVHFLCRITRSTSRFRRYHLACVGLCLLLTWTYFALDKTELLIGHYLWAAGAILITSADLLLPGHPRGAP